AVTSASTRRTGTHDSSGSICWQSHVRLLAADRVPMVKLLGMVNATPDFADHGKVIDGCSDLLAAVLGANGQQPTCVGRDEFAAGSDHRRDRGDHPRPR